MKTIIISVCALLGAIIMLFISFYFYYIGYNSGKTDVYNDEFTHYGILLEYANVDKESKLHEFMKLRYYYLSYYVNQDIFNDLYNDYGQPNTNILFGFSGGKESIPREDYLQFLNKRKKL